MIPPDHEIFEVEQRLALRRTQLKRHASDASTRALQALTSPVALIAAAGLGFLAANSFARRRREPPHPERRKSDHTKAAKATGLAGLLTTDGYVATEEAADASVVVFNTCAIRENADNRLYGNLGHLRPLKQANPRMRIVVAGCLAQKDGGAIRRRAPWVDVVVGTTAGWVASGALLLVLTVLWGVLPRVVDQVDDLYGGAEAALAEAAFADRGIL